MADSTNFQPITGLCIVSDPIACPMGYEVLFRSHDKDEDCDLWKDSFFRSKVTRYLCITRIYPLEGGKLNNILADIVVNNERDIPPTGFSLIDVTVDTREKATRKKQICVRMLPRNSTTDAITDVILLSRNKRPPTHYTLVGEINGLLLCYKMGSVPPETRSPHHSSSTPTHVADSASTTGAPSMNTNYQMAPPLIPTQAPPIPPKPPVKRQDSLLPGAGLHALEGVPFVLNPKYQDVQELKSVSIPEIHYRSLVDIENEFSYKFNVEKTATRRISGRK